MERQKCQIMGSIPTTGPMYRHTGVPAYPRTGALTYRRAAICNLVSIVFRRFFLFPFLSWSSPISWGGKRNQNWVLSFHWFDPEDDCEIVAEKPSPSSTPASRPGSVFRNETPKHARKNGRRWCPPSLQQAYKRPVLGLTGEPNAYDTPRLFGCP